MIIKNKKLKYIIILAITLILLCIGKSVKAENETIIIEHGRGDEPIDCTEDKIIYPNDYYQGKDGINFFCKNEWMSWNFYSQNSEKLYVIDQQRFKYEEQRQEELEPTISFGLYTAKELGWIDLETIQHLIWGSVKYSSITCQEGNASYYSGALNTILKRADQFGMFYYGVLGGGAHDLDCTVSGGDTAKVYVNQKDRKVIVGPYQIDLICHNVTSIDEETIKANLYNELSGNNAKLYPGAPSFGECHIEVDGATDTKFLDKDGVVVQFPNFNEPFYIECIVENDVTSIHPKVNIKYIRSAKASAFYYASLESETDIPGYAVSDKWYDDQGIDAIVKGKGDAHDSALNFIKDNMSVRRHWLCQKRREFVA